MPERPGILIALIALALGAAAGLIVGLADDKPEMPGPIAAEEPTAEVPGADEAKRDRGSSEPAETKPSAPLDRDDEPGTEAGPSGPAPSTTDERATAATMREYVAGLDRRRTGAVCSVLEPGAVAQLDFPHKRDSCPASLRASLGFRDQRGMPVWEGSELTEAISSRVSGDTARVVATVVTTYADVREPTVEDDIVYMSAASGRWRIVKPSATILRAIGVADFPPSVLAPPR